MPPFGTQTGLGPGRTRKSLTLTGKVSLLLPADTEASTGGGGGGEYPELWEPGRFKDKSQEQYLSFFLFFSPVQEGSGLCFDIISKVFCPPCPVAYPHVFCADITLSGSFERTTIEVVSITIVLFFFSSFSGIVSRARVSFDIPTLLAKVLTKKKRQREKTRTQLPAKSPPIPITNNPVPIRAKSWRKPSETTSQRPTANNTFRRNVPIIGYASSYIKYLATSLIFSPFFVNASRGLVK